MSSFLRIFVDSVTELDKLRKSGSSVHLSQDDIKDFAAFHQSMIEIVKKISLT